MRNKVERKNTEEKQNKLETKNYFLAMYFLLLIWEKKRLHRYLTHLDNIGFRQILFYNPRKNAEVKIQRKISNKHLKLFTTELEIEM